MVILVYIMSVFVYLCVCLSAFVKRLRTNTNGVSKKFCGQETQVRTDRHGNGVSAPWTTPFSGVLFTASVLSVDDMLS